MGEGGDTLCTSRLCAAADDGAVRSHGLRHTAITQALDDGHSPRDVMRFNRHSKLETGMIYDDNRRDLAGKGAARVASHV